MNPYITGLLGKDLDGSQPDFVQKMKNVYGTCMDIRAFLFIFKLYMLHDVFFSTLYKINVTTLFFFLKTVSLTSCSYTK